MITPSQLGEWFDAYAPRLTLYARQFVGPALAEDVVHDVFVNLMTLTQPPRQIRPFLFAAVRNAALTSQRGTLRRRRRETSRAGASPLVFENRPDNLLNADAVQTVLAALPAEQREVVSLRIWADLTYQEIADLTALPLTTVYNHYQSALRTMKNRLESPCQTKTKT